MHLRVLLEEQSSAAALEQLMPKMLRESIPMKPVVFQGKPDLLKKLDSTLRAFQESFPKDHRIVVLLDEDRQNCSELKDVLERAARNAGFRTKSTARPGERYRVLNRIAIEELEAWFLGDVPALTKAYPLVPRNLGSKPEFRDPDNIRGGTWEALEAILQAAGYYPGGLPKIEVAVRIARHMVPDRNRSRSFQVFRDGLRALVAQ